MTNNNLETPAKIRLNTILFRNGQNTDNLDLLDMVIEEIVTKKDQEHKAELEMIREVFWEVYNKNSDYYSESTEKGEMDNSNEAAYATAVLNQVIKGLRYKGIELEDTTSILDSHINKLSTE